MFSSVRTLTSHIVLGPSSRSINLKKGGIFARRWIRQINVAQFPNSVHTPSLVSLCDSREGRRGENFKFGVPGLKFGSVLSAGGLVLSSDENENEVEAMVYQEVTDEVLVIEDKEPDTASGNTVDVVSEPITKKPKIDTTAPVWKFAEKIGLKEAKCSICKKMYKTSQGNTSNITDHIVSKHGHTDEGKELKALLDKKKKEQNERKQKDVNHQENNSIERFVTIDRPVSETVREAIDNSVVEFIIASNQSFSLVENPFFRKMCFTLNRGYTLHSRRELVRKVDTKIEKLKELLAIEIQGDIKSHKSVHITSDGGNSGDQNKTHKNTVTVTRISDDWQMKTDTIAVPEAVGSQTGIVLRTQWKEELEKVGYDGSWKVSVTTDAAKNERSARGVGRHEEVGLKIKFEADCVDHQIQLLIKDSRKNNGRLKESLKKSRKLINHFSKSSLSSSFW